MKFTVILLFVGLITILSNTQEVLAGLCSCTCCRNRPTWHCSSSNFSISVPCDDEDCEDRCLVTNPDCPAPDEPGRLEAHCISVSGALDIQQKAHIIVTMTLLLVFQAKI